VFFDLTSAQTLIAADSNLLKNDQRAKLARAAIAAQLNENNGAVAPAGLLDLAADWLLGYKVLVKSDGSFSVSGTEQPYSGDSSSGQVTPYSNPTPPGPNPLGTNNGTFGQVLTGINFNTATGFTKGNKVSASSDAWALGGSAIFTALQEFNQDPIGGGSTALIVSKDGTMVASVDETTHTIKKELPNTLNNYLHLIS
jgi:hypothetical protein